MRLSDGMTLGTVLGTIEYADIDHCIIGAAATAVGIPRRKLVSSAEDTRKRYDAIIDTWPWLGTNSEARLLEIAYLFDNKVSTGEMTLDQLIEYVRSIEPSCGECCSFDCCCEIGDNALNQMLTQIPAESLAESVQE